MAHKTPLLRSLACLALAVLSSVVHGQAAAAPAGQEADLRFEESVVLYGRGDFRGSLRAAEEALKLYEASGDRKGQADALRFIGNSSGSLGDMQRGIDSQQRSLAIAREIGYRQGEAKALGNLGVAYFATDRYQEAIDFHTQNLEISRQLGDRKSEAAALNNLGSTYEALGQYHRAIEHHQRALAIRRGIGDRAGEADSLGNLGRAYQALSQYPRAIEHLERSLAIHRGVGDRAGEAFSLVNLGAAYHALGQYPRAVECYERSLTIWREIGDRAGEAASLGSLGDAYYALDRYPLAIEHHEQSLKIAREIGDRQGEAASLSGLGIAYEALGRYPLAIESQQQSLRIQREIGDRAGEAASLSGLGNLFYRTDRYSQAIESFEKALAIQRGIGDRAGEAGTLRLMGSSFMVLGQDAKAVEHHERSLAIAREIGDSEGEAASLRSLAFVRYQQYRYPEAVKFSEQALAISRRIGDRAGEAAALSTLGSACFYMEETVRGIEAMEGALAIYRAIGDPVGEAASLGRLGDAYRSAGQHSRAIDLHRQRLAISRGIGDRAFEAGSLGALGRSYQALSEPVLAIVFLKEAINVYEAIRGDNRALSRDLQSSYTESVSGTYRRLADLLLQQDRVLEAERVLDLLKVQELQDYLTSVRGNARTASGIEFSQPEQEIVSRHAQLQGSAVQIGQRLAQLQRMDRESGGLGAELVAERNRLYEAQKAVGRQFNAFLEDPAVKEAVGRMTRGEGGVPLAQLAGLRDQLKRLEAALIYPLVLEDRVEIVLSLPDSAPLRRTVEGVGRVRLNEAIGRFRAALQDPKVDAKGPAYELYRWLIEPLEADLAAAGVKTLLYAPDGPLRYIPLAALYDAADPAKGRWLVERFRINNITATSLQELDSKPAAAPRILAGAFADRSVSYSVAVGDRTERFSGLPFAGVEVRTLAEMLPGARTYLDRDFSLAALEPQLNNFNILHFATHAALVPKDAGETFILFGNGDRPTIRDVAEWPLQDVDLVVLSACETGLGGKDGSGAEVLGLGYQFQQAGARAVIASLWQVDDGGTQALMSAFYQAIGKGYGKAEALQRAQRALIADDLSFVGGARGAARKVEGADRRPLVLRGPSEHPYYWAPFILIGNGL